VTTTATFWATVISSGSPYSTGPLPCLSYLLSWCTVANGWRD